MTDEQLEAAILSKYEDWLEDRATWAEVVGLITRRSESQVAKMEAERGLAR